MNANEMFVALFRNMPVPWVVLPSAPVLVAIVPPEAAAPVPTTVKLPLVFERMIPLLAPPEEETLVSETTSGVVPLARVISTAVAPLLLIAPLLLVMVPLLFVATRPL